MVKLVSGFAHLAQTRLAALGHARCAGLVDIHMRAVGKIPNGIGKTEVVGLHYETERIAAFAAAEAMPQLRARVYLARRRLLVVEGTAAPVLTTSLAQWHTLAEERNDIGCLANLVDVLIADCHAVVITQTMIGVTNA